MVLHGATDVSDNSAIPADRQTRIFELLRRHGQVNALALASKFSVSEDTIRRDLRDMASRGLCKKVYGGAILTSPASTSISVRSGEFSDRKSALGKALAELIQPNQFIFIDAGSTNLAFARSIPPDLPLTIATHDPAIAACLVGRPGTDLVMIGGEVHAEIGAALGAHTVEEIAHMHPDLVVLGACSIHAQWGVGAFHYGDAAIKKALIRSSGSIALAVLNEKLTSAAAYKIAELDAVAELVVEADAAESETKALAERVARIHWAAPVS